MSAYLKIRPEVAAPWDEECKAFLVGLQFDRDGGDSLLQIEIQPMLADSKPAVRMDLTYRHVGKPLQHEEAGRWLDSAHGAIGDLFEASITDEMRATFDASEAARS
jgi:uncharacterized protein (TIGR04255 family)